MGKRISRIFADGLICLFVLANAHSCSAETNRAWKKKWIAAAVVLVGANIFDAYSSHGLHERNPFLRGPQGRFSSSKGVAIKSAASGGFLAVQMILLKKMPERNLEKPLAITTAAAAGITGATAIHNYVLRRPMLAQ